MHKLQKNIIEAKYYDESGVDRFYSSTLQLFYDELKPEMVRILDKHAGNDKLIKINNLTVDLGVLYESGLEQQWRDRLSEEFEKELLKKIHLIGIGQGEKNEVITTIYKNELESLMHFLISGSLPWFADTTITDIKVLFDKILVHQESQLSIRLRAEPQKEILVSRMVLQFTDEQITRLIEAIQPSESKFIIESVAEIRRVQQRIRIVKSGSREFNNILWSFILTYIFNQRGSYINTREFTLVFLQQIADKYNVNFKWLIQEIFKGIYLLQLNPIHFSMGSILKEIYESDNSIRVTPIEKNIEQRTIREYLRSGKLETKVPKAPMHNLGKLLIDWLTIAPLEFNDFLKKEGDIKIFRRITNILMENEIRQLVTMLAPAEAPFIIDFSEEIVNRQEEQNWVQVDRNQFKNDLWLIILDLMLNDRGSFFNQKVFVLTALEKLSKHYNLNSSFFLHEIITIINLQPNKFKSAYLRRILLDISNDFKSKKKKEQLPERIRINAYFEYLQDFVFETSKSEKTIQSFTIIGSYPPRQELIEYLLNEEPAAFKIWIKKILISEIAAEKFIDGLQKELIIKLIKLIQVQTLSKYTRLIKILTSRIPANETNTGTLSEVKIFEYAFIFSAAKNLKSKTEDEFLIYVFKRVVQENKITESQFAEYLLETIGKSEDSYSLKMKDYIFNEFQIPNKPQKPGSNKKGIEEINKTQSKKENEEILQKTQEVIESIVFPKQKTYKALDNWENEILKISAFEELNKWFDQKTISISKTDTKRLKQFLNLYFRKLEERKWQTNQPQLEKLSKLYQSVSFANFPFIEAYVIDLEILFKELKAELSGISINWIKSMILLFWATDQVFAQIEITEFLIEKLSLKTNQPKQELKNLFFEKAKKIQRKLSSTIIMNLAEEKDPPEKLLYDIAELNIKDAEKEDRLDFLINESEKEETEIAEDEPVYIGNAGLVLLNPFLPVLFERTGLLRNRSFIDKTSQIKAVHLLQYLVDFSDDHPEYLLFLPKFLCGFEHDNPIRKKINIRKSERELVKDLLENVIQQWKTLANTTTEGFQQSFLQRNGAIRMIDNSWHLDIELKSFDMLIDKIPWSFTLINYPWMDKPLFTNWR